MELCNLVRVPGYSTMNKWNKLIAEISLNIRKNRTFLSNCLKMPIGGNMYPNSLECLKELEICDTVLIFLVSSSFKQIHYI